MPGGQNPISLEYKIHPPTIDTLVSGMTITTMLIIDNCECYTFGYITIALHITCLLVFVGFLKMMLILSVYDLFSVHNSPRACLHV